MLATLIAAAVILAVPAILVLAVLSMFGSLIAALADGRFSIVRPPSH
jgi:hypothetical protein